MIVTLMSWSIIFLLSLTLGNIFIRKIMVNTFENTTRLDIYVVAGLMVLDAYAQIYSILAGVSKMAFCLVTVITGFLFLFLLADQIKNKKMLKIDFGTPWKMCIIIALFGVILLYTIKAPEFVDTYLYHIQAIRWIEEYGAVPGLGNLHNRFAYNSAFLPLQALFSFSWVTDPLHTLNGFLGIFFVIYAVMTNHIFTSEDNTLSDFLKLIVFPYILLNRRTISSPNTDTLAMLLVLYITIKWCECIEKEEEIQSYGVLCLFSVWAITVKISTAACLVFAILPIFSLLKRHDWKNILKDLIIGIVIISPWFVRNIIISGYLVYPYSGIDLFHVDWKMPAELLDYDRKEIAVYGREVRDVSKYEDSIVKWFETWFSSQMFRNKLLIVLGFGASVCLIVILVIIIINCIRNKVLIKTFYLERKNLLLVISILLGETFWFFSAPLVRYGMVYLMMPIAVIYFFLEKMMGNILNRYVIVLGTGILVLILLFKNDDFRMVFPQGYWNMDSNVNNWEGTIIYSSTDDRQLNDYFHFPAVTDKRILNEIEMRGNDLSEGFRVKE